MTSLPDFHELRVVVSHPRDGEGELLIRCLQRLGSTVEWMWPPADALDRQVDLLICLFDSAARTLLETTTSVVGPAVLGIVDPERAEGLRLVSEVTPHAVMVRPITQAAIVPNIVLARNTAKYQLRQLGKIAKLEETLRSYRKVEQAKAILMQQRAIGEPEAYNFLREQAMRRRVPVGVIASAVVDLNEVLSEKKK
ncbi:MAG: ANTAR domain-containing protein [Pseudomonadota bacterium]|nr:ANTAR domain-containing protein [Pseudomonadota bacterium]